MDRWETTHSRRKQIGSGTACVANVEHGGEAGFRWYVSHYNSNIGGHVKTSPYNNGTSPNSEKSLRACARRYGGAP